MWGALEAEEEVIKANGSMGTETVAHSGEVNGAMMFVDLNGVATAEGDVGAAFSGKVREDALAADSAVWVWGAGVDLAALVCPEVVTEDGATHEVGLVREEFECFGSLNGSGQVDGRGEDPGGVAGFDGTGGGLGKDAGEAGGLAGEDVHGDGVGTDSCSVDPGFGLLDGVVVEEVTGFEVVSGVEDEVCGA